MAQIKDTLDEIRNRIVDEMVDLMNQYGLKEWVFGLDNDCATMWERLDDDTVVRSWVNTIRLDENNILTLDIDYEGHSNNDCSFDIAFDGVFTDSMVELLAELRYELRTYFMDLMRVWLIKNGYTDRKFTLDGQTSFDGMKPIGIYLQEEGIMLDIADAPNTKRLSDFSDDDLPYFVAYFRTQIKNTPDVDAICYGRDDLLAVAEKMATEMGDVNIGEGLVEVMAKAAHTHLSAIANGKDYQYTNTL